MIHRKPPMPRWVPAGHCRYCAQPIVYPAGHDKAGQRIPRLSWHPRCVKPYRVAAFSSDQRSALRAAAKPLPVKCFLCGANQRVDLMFEWDADHIVPLWSLPANVALNRRACFWSKSNLWVLCRTCHAAKTKREAGVRVLWRNGKGAQSDGPARQFSA